MSPQRIAPSTAFRSTPAVTASRLRLRYVSCAICRADHSEYLFHRVGVRFVRCRNCGLVYVNPAGDAGPNWLAMDGLPQHGPAERALHLADFEALLTRLEARYVAVTQRPLTRTVLLGRFCAGLVASPVARRVGLVVVPTTDAEFARLNEAGDTSYATRALGQGTQMVVLTELFEACSEPAVVASRIAAALPRDAWVAVTYSNSQSLPALVLRRYWSSFFELKTSFFNTRNMAAMMADQGYVLTAQFPQPVTHTASYVVERLAPDGALARVLSATPLGKVTTPVRTGAHVALFRRPPAAAGAARTREKLSIVLPVWNEERYVEHVIETLLAKELKVDRELIIVESNSTDGTREKVKKFEGRPGVKVLYEDRPQGKGHAVKTGLRAVTGTIVLIQDADFEYDIDDYDALLEPILQHRTSFVLGSRSLGLDDWKVRRFEGTATKRVLLNVAQVVFAHTFNLLYQQRITDVNTMFKVFRSECLEGLDLESDGFNLDIELACKLVRNGNAPMEVPVNYVARGFDQGKKISFLRDAFPSYAAFFKYRFR